MNPMRTLAKILLISLALYFLIYIAFSLATYTVMILTTSSAILGNVFYFIFTLSGWFLVGLLLIYFLILKADFWAGKIAGEEEQKDALKNVFWLPAAFKLIFVIGGIFVLYWTIPNIIRTICSLINIKRYNLGPFSDAVDSAMVITWIVQVAIGIYLILGAPHFVRWHIKKILKTSKEENPAK